VSPKKGGTGGIDPNSLVKLWIFGGGEPNLGAVAWGWIEVSPEIALRRMFPPNQLATWKIDSFHVADFDAPSCHVEEPLRLAHSLDLTRGSIFSQNGKNDERSYNPLIL